MMHSPSDEPLGLTAVGIFLLFGMCMAALAGVTLWHPGTFLDRAWALNPRAYIQLSALGTRLAAAFSLLSLAMALAALGWFGRRRWGWQLTVLIISTQVIGDLVSFIQGEYLRAGTGVAIAGALLVYLTRKKTRRAFLRSVA